MKDEASRNAPEAESGGVVLGYWATAGEGVVTHTTRPGPKAVRERSRFIPDPEHDDFEIERIWRETAGASTYLGDWHSHPKSNGHLSWIDRRTVDRIAAAPEAFAPLPLMLVMAKPVDRWQLNAWRGKRSTFGWFHWLRCERVEVLDY